MSDAFAESSFSRGLFAAQYAVALILAEAPNLTEATPKLLEAIGQALDWPLGAIWEVDREDQLLIRVAGWHAHEGDRPLFEALARTTAFERGNGLPGRVWDSGEPTWVPEVSEEPVFRRLHSLWRAGLRSAFAFPITSGGSVVGVMEFFSGQPRPRDQELLYAMVSLGGQIGQYTRRRRAEEEAFASDARKTAMIESALDCVVAMDEAGRVVEFNPAAERAFGYTREQVIGQEMATLIVPPALRERHRAGLARYLESGEGHILGKRLELHGMRADGSEFPVELAITRVNAPGPPLFTGYIRDTTDRVRIEQEREAGIDSEHRARMRAERLQTATAALSQAVTPEEVVGAILQEAVAATSADATAVALLNESGSTLQIAGSIGYSVEAIAQWQTFAVDADLLLAEAVRSGRALFLESGEARAASHPPLATIDAGVAAASATLPLCLRGAARGALGLVYASSHSFDRDERAFLQQLAEQCAQALERARLYAAEERALRQAEQAREQLAFLAEASEALAQSLDYEQTLSRVAFLAVPRVADWCSVDLVDDDGSLRNVAVAHADPTKMAMAAEMQRRFPPDPQAPTGAPNVVRTGRSELHPEIPEELLAASISDPEQLRLTRELGLVSAMAVPLNARERTLGAITLVSAESGRHYTSADLGLAEDLARRAALAIDNARLYREEQRIAETLQRSLLPEVLPKIPEVALAVRYLPAGDEFEVGGDWYDAIPLSDGRVGLVIGDVVGHGIAAAAVMGQLRNALRAYALEGHAPAIALERLSQLIEIGQPASMLGTLIFLIYDPVESTVRFASAGHPPPLVASPEGGCRYLEGGRSVPIGAVRRARFDEVEVRLEPGATLLLYTDGLVERRSEGLDEGLARLAEVVCGGPADLEELCDHILTSAARNGASHDDVALIALRPLPPMEEGPDLALSAEPAAITDHALEHELATAAAGEQ